jgi:hypothetical protein
MSSSAKFDPARLESQLKQLSAAARTLNELSDELTAQVERIEGILGALNLGVRAHVDVETLSSSEDGMFTHWLRLAYGRRKQDWGFLIEELVEDLNNPQTDDCEVWAFRKAPRDFRLKAVDSIPALLEKLLKESAEAASSVTKKVEFTTELASSLSRFRDGAGQ